MGDPMSEPVRTFSLPRSTPEEQGVQSGNIQTFLEGLEARKFNMHSFMLIRHGKVVAEGWWSPYRPEHKRYLYSLSKSFCSTAVGFAVSEGLFSVDDQVISFFPNDLPETISDNLSAMRVKDLLTMTTGHAIDSTLMVLPVGLVNWAESILSISVDHSPGSHFLYNTGATYLLSCIVQKTSGQTVLGYLTPRFFEPLGISGVTWEVCPRGINAGGWGLSVRTEDLAKFGQFYLQKGIWNGKLLLPAAWVEAATAAQVSNVTEERLKEPEDWLQGYGYQFWCCRHEAYRADGAFGQFCVVMPGQDAVLVVTSETQDMQGILDLAWENILTGMKEVACEPQPVALESLRSKTASLRIVPPAGQVAPAEVPDISGKRYEIKDNDAGIQSVSFVLETDSCVFQLRDGNGEHQIVCGTGTWQYNETEMPVMQPTMMDILFNRRIHCPVKVAAHGEWKDPETFAMTWQYLETPHSNKVTCKFEGDGIQIDVTSSIKDPNNPILRDLVSRFTGSLAKSRVI